MGSFCCQVVDRRAVSEVAMDQQTGDLQGIKDPIDRRLVDVGFLFAPGGVEDGGGGEMLTMSVGNNGAYGASCRSDPQTLVAQCLN